MLEIVSAEMLTAEVVSLVEAARRRPYLHRGAAAGDYDPTRYLCKRLRTRFPACKILVGRWGWTGESDANRALLPRPGPMRWA